MNVKSTSPYNILFTGIRGTEYQGDIALDDISLIAGTCFNVAQCKSLMFSVNPS